ncbi:uncharacterized protein [Ptychodera flava]|uniref:uncharacterized protein n=1 Tax=Ptychodera flava TaxID=63121 RepID=UPI00396A1CCD
MPRRLCTKAYDGSQSALIRTHLLSVLSSFPQADFPPDALFNEEWFNIKNDDNTTHYSLLKLMITNINIKAPLIPLQVTVHTRDRILYTDVLWFNFVGCSEGKYGFKCDKECICQNDAECSVFNGACNCKRGWYGPACDIPKPDIELIPMREEVEYGSYTSLTCVVTNTEFEDKNFVGTNVFSWSLKNDSGIKKCIDDNTEDFYIEDTVVGTSVLQIKHGISVKTEGRYECKVTDKYDRVYIASATVKTTCPKNIFGRYCNRSCDCATGASISCDRYLGCECNSGWTGRHCHIDTISPTFDRCPQEITKVIKDDETRTNITWQVPTANDNSNNVTVHSSYTPGDVFVIGTTVVRYTAVDSSNNTVYCQFRVNVIVQEKLKIGLSIGIPIVCIVFLLPLFFFLGYRYRLQFYLVFTRDWDIDEDLGDKDYDGFLSYSSKDGDFAEAIMKNLEKNGKFKLLLHHRDFIAGKGILDNIEDSFDNSRAAILVISPNFLESGTCEHEARIALDNWINRRQKLIPIVKGNVEQANNSQVIKRIMKFITYIQWPENASAKEEDAFWRELENALDINMQRQTRVASFTRALANVFRCGRNGYSRVRNHVV